MTKAEKTKQLLIEKIAPIFNLRGYAGTSMKDMIIATGLSKGSIYGNFKNKDEVALAAFDYNYGKVSDFLKSEILTKENAIERLFMYPKTFSKFLSLSLFQGGCPIQNTTTEADDTHPLLKEKAKSALTSWKNTIEAEIKRGIERKEIKPETNSKEIAIVMISMIEGAILQTKAFGRKTELHITMKYVEKLILDIKE